MGDFVRSTTGEILGNPDKPIRFVPLKMVATWIIQEEINGKFEYRRTEPRNASNEQAPWSFTENGTKWRRVQSLDVYSLLVSDIEKFQSAMSNMADGELPDLNMMLLPVVISFRSMSFKAGKSVATFFAQVRDLLRFNANAKSYGYSLELQSVADKNDKGSFYVFKIGTSKKLDAALLPDAERWYQNLSNLASVRVDEGSETTVEPTEAPTINAQTKF
jgi:hypothetical protein